VTSPQFRGRSESNSSETWALGITPPTDSQVLYCASSDEEEFSLLPNGVGLTQQFNLDAFGEASLACVSEVVAGNVYSGSKKFTKTSSDGAYGFTLGFEGDASSAVPVDITISAAIAVASAIDIAASGFAGGIELGAASAAATADNIAVAGTPGGITVGAAAANGTAGIASASIAGMPVELTVSGAAVALALATQVIATNATTGQTIVISSANSVADAGSLSATGTEATIAVGVATASATAGFALLTSGTFLVPEWRQVAVAARQRVYAVKRLRRDVQVARLPAIHVVRR
jgi:hypothetical protein